MFRIYIALVKGSRAIRTLLSPTPQQPAGTTPAFPARKRWWVEISVCIGSGLRVCLYRV